MYAIRSYYESIAREVPECIVGAGTIVSSRQVDDVLLNWDTVLAAKMWRSFTEMLS